MRKIVIIVSSIILSILLLVGIFFEVTFSPLEKARVQALTLAKENGLMKSPTKFYWYKGEKVALSLYGKNEEDMDVYIIMVPDEEKAFAYYAHNLLNEDQARAISQEGNQHTISSVTLGILDDKPIWEVIVYDNNKHIGYDIILATDGTILQRIRTE